MLKISLKTCFLGLKKSHDQTLISCKGALCACNDSNNKNKFLYLIHYTVYSSVARPWIFRRKKKMFIFVYCSLWCFSFNWVHCSLYCFSLIFWALFTLLFFIQLGALFTLLFFIISLRIVHFAVLHLTVCIFHFVVFKNFVHYSLCFFSLKCSFQLIALWPREKKSITSSKYNLKTFYCTWLKWVQCWLMI